jgi:WD40 repeat protein
MFDYLVTPSGTKIAHEVADLERYAGAPHPSVVSVLDKLSDDRIVRPVSNGNADGARYEIFHDVLAQPVLAWKATHDSQRELDRQRAESERRHRRLLGIVAVGAVALVVMAGVTIVAITQRSRARSQADIARAAQLAALSVSQLQNDPQRSLVLAVEAAERKPTSESEDVLRQALLTARERAILPSGGPVTAASFNRDGSRVLTASVDGSTRIWRRDGTAIRMFRQRGPVTAAHFSPDGRLVLATSADGTARIWHTDGRRVASLEHGGPVTDGFFSSDGTMVITTSKDGTARLWRAADGTPVGAIHQRGPVWSASLSRDDKLLVTVGSNPDGTNRRARVFTLPSGHLLHELPARRVRTASLSPDGLLVVTGGADHKAALWEAASGRPVYLLGKHLGVVTDAEFAPGGRLVATTSTDGATRVWGVRTGIRVALLLGHVNAVNHAAFSTDGNLLVTASSDGTARVWEAATGRPQFTLRGHADTGPVVDAQFSSDGHAVVTASSDGTARVWDASTAPQLRVVATSGKGAVRAASFSPDGRSILVAGDDGQARIVVGRKVVRTLPHPAPVTSAIFDRDGRLVFTADKLRTVRVWRVDTGALVKAVRDFSSGPLSVSPDGRLLAARVDGGRIRIVDAATFAEVRELREGAPFASAAFSPDGRRIATAGLDGVARIWDAGTGALIRPFKGHRRALTDAEFSGDGKLLVTSSRDHEARVWQVDTGAVTILHGHSGTVFRASFSPDDRFVVTAGPTTAGVWVVSSGHRLTYLRGHDRRLTSASFAPDDWRILTSSRDGTARMFNCRICRPVDDLLALAEARLSSLADPLTPAARRRYVPPGGVAYATR